MIAFRKTLMATTVLAGFAIFATDAAQAGPNGGPSLGSISGFSSMRMDFNRVGGPSRALSRDDTRLVPLDVKKTEKAPKENKSVAKKGIDTARVSNPKSVTGGKAKEVASTPALRIPAPIADLYDVTGGNLEDISKFAEIATWLTTGVPGLGSPLFPGRSAEDVWSIISSGSDGSSVPPTLGTPGRFGWGDTKGGPGNGTPQRIGNPDGKASGDAWRITGEGDYGGGVHWIEVYNKQENRYRVISFDGNGYGHQVRDYAPGREPGTSLPVSTTRIITIPDDEPIVITAGEKGSEKEGAEKENSEKEKAEKEKDSQPAEEGSGRPRGMHTVRCDIAGCVDYGMKDGRRTNPGHTDGSGGETGGGSALPSWATDPCPDCSGRGSGGGGFRRPGGSDLGWRGNGEDGGFEPVPEPHS